MINIKRCTYCGEPIEEPEYPLQTNRGLLCHAKCFVISKSIKEFAEEEYRKNVEDMWYDDFNFICHQICCMFLCSRCQKLCNNRDCMDYLYRFLLHYELHSERIDYGKYYETRWKYKLKPIPNEDIAKIFSEQMQNRARGLPNFF